MVVMEHLPVSVARLVFVVVVDDAVELHCLLDVASVAVVDDDAVAAAV